MNLRLRFLEYEDLDDLCALAEMHSHGLTTLPPDREVLKQKLEYAVASIQSPVRRPNGQLYFFGLEDLDTDQVVGTSAIVSKVGGFEPFYAYELKELTHRSKELGIHNKHRVLSLAEIHNGPTEIGSLFLHPDYRRGKAGKLLSLTRFLYMAQYPERFEPTVIAEMRGVVDERGNSPFWEAIGRHFFPMDFPTADYLSVVKKSVIADLMPRHPIYVDMLPMKAQEVINRVHPKTEPALAILQKQGFAFTGSVDIFDGGPVVSCQLPDIKAVQTSKVGMVASIQPTVAGETALIMNCCDTPFAAIGQIQETRSYTLDLAISVALAESLLLQIGDSVRYLKV